jgi:hypothetical protein
LTDHTPIPLKIRDAKGATSAYTLIPVPADKIPETAYGARCYRVEKAKKTTPDWWIIDGYNGRVLLFQGNVPEPPEYVRVAVEREWAKDQLRETLPPGSTAYTILRQVSSSGMSRHISVSGPDHEYLDGLVALALDYPTAKDGSLRVGGCGMDMGFAVVSDLSYALYPHGFDCLGEHCPSNDHSNGDRDYTSHHHSSGDYALRQWWL